MCKWDRNSESIEIKDLFEEKKEFTESEERKKEGRKRKKQEEKVSLSLSQFLCIFYFLKLEGIHPWPQQRLSERPIYWMPPLSLHL